MNNLTQQSDEEPAWYVVKALSKTEAATARLVEKFVDCEVFCPRLRYKKATKRGAIWWVEAMFPCYFFARFIYVEQYRHVQSQPGVMGLVKFAQQAPTVSDEIIEQLRAALDAANDDGEEILELVPSIEVGDEIEVATGPFKGEKGAVSRVRPSVERVSLLLEFLGETKEVEFNLYDLLTGKPQPATR